MALRRHISLGRHLGKVAQQALVGRHVLQLLGAVDSSMVAPDVDRFVLQQQLRLAKRIAITLVRSGNNRVGVGPVRQHVNVVVSAARTAPTTAYHKVSRQGFVDAHRNPSLSLVPWTWWRLSEERASRGDAL